MPKKEDAKKKVVVVEEVEPTEVVEETKKVEKSEEPQTPEITKPVESVASVEPVEPVEPVAEEFDKPNYLWIVIPTALLVGALVGGLITYFSGLSRLGEADKTPSPIPTVVDAEPSPTASPSSTLKRDGLKIQVLNGSGISGAAGKAKTLLEGLGYTSVDTGNALSSNFVKTEVAYKESAKEYLDLIIKDLSKEYEATAAAKVLPTSSKYDIVITLGVK